MKIENRRPLGGIVFRVLLIWAAVVAACPVNAFAQEDVASKGFFYPDELNIGEFKSNILLTLAKLPEDVVEEVNSFIYAPLLSYEAQIGLPHGFSVQGGASSNYITFRFSIGPRWSYRTGRFAFSIGDDVAYVFGEIHDFGFASSARGWMNHPDVAAGFAFNKFTLTVKGDATFITSFKQFADDIEVSSDRNFLRSYSIGIFIEQPLWKDNYITLGARAKFAKFYYPAWAAFPTWNRYHFIPEIIIGFIP